MALESATPRSRRALLTGTFAGLAAWAAAALGRAAPASAADHAALIQGEDNNGSLSTVVRVSAATPAIQGVSDATSGTSYGVRGRNSSTSGAGVLGVAAAATGGIRGVLGQAPSSPTGVGVRGEGPYVGVEGVSTGANGRAMRAIASGSSTSLGVEAVTTSPSGVGVLATAHATTGATVGVIGSVASSSGVGVRGVATAATGNTVAVEAIALSGASGAIAARGQSTSGIGVFGYSGTAAFPPLLPRTGVFGFAGQDATSNGVCGGTTGGVGVRGYATNGVAVWATANADGEALHAIGKVAFSRSGRALVGPGKSYVDVTVPDGLAGTPLPFANLLLYRAGVYVAAVRPNYPTTGKMRIYLNKVASASYTTAVSWMVLG